MTPSDYALAKAIEEASLNAWPALQQMLYDGWVLRFARGYTRRANSINGVYPGTLPVSEKIKHCERVYKAKGLPPTFRITPFMDPPDLEAVLDQAGYEKMGPTSLQTLDLRSLSPEMSPSFQQWDKPADAWINHYIQMNGLIATHRPNLEGILANIGAEAYFTTLLEGDQTVACGLGVLEGQYVGLFDIVTHPAWRGRGLAAKLIMNILNWAKSRGAQTAYLQVMLENTPALKLYTRLGFKELYRYWYRVPRMP